MSTELHPLMALCLNADRGTFQKLIELVTNSYGLRFNHADIVILPTLSALRTVSY